MDPIIFPGPASRGTWNCVKYMKGAHIEVDVWGIPRTRKWLEGLGQT